MIKMTTINENRNNDDVILVQQEHEPTYENVSFHDGGVENVVEEVKFRPPYFLLTLEAWRYNLRKI